MKFKNKLLLFFCATLCFNALFAQDNFEEYFQLLNKKSHIDFSILKNPFINPTIEKIKQIKITAIILNKVKIEDKWYKKGDKFDHAIISEINTKEIKFAYDDMEILIQFNKNDKIIIH